MQYKKESGEYKADRHKIFEPVNDIKLDRNCRDNVNTRAKYDKHCQKILYKLAKLPEMWHGRSSYNTKAKHLIKLISLYLHPINCALYHTRSKASGLERVGVDKILRVNVI